MFVWYEYLVLGLYLVAILSIGAWFSRKGSSNVDEYFLGGKSLPWWVLGISFMTSNLDLTGTMVIGSFFAIAGLKGFLVELRGGTALSMALFMVFMAKWHRRAGVMTIAEWMEFRFGTGPGGSAARLVSAIGIVILVIGMMTYFAVGFGKFLSLYFPLSPIACATVFTGIATLHILFSGLYGVAFTDLLQGAMVLFVVVYVSVLAYFADPAEAERQEAWARLGQTNMTLEEWGDITPSWTVSFPEAYAAYDLFGMLLLFWVLRIFLEGFGGPLIPYASQRFFAARDDREASLVTGFSLALFVIRWPLIVGVAILGIGLGAAIPNDPEMIFPMVISTHFPGALRAIVVACMIAAAMSTFDSTVNAGGAYLVNDIWRRFLRPHASTKELMRVTWVFTVALTVSCLLLASTIETINEIWSWISMSLFGGMAMPLVLRWYWERFNGWGYAIGTVVGILAALSVAFYQSTVGVQLNEALQIGIVSLVSLAASVLATLATQPDGDATVREFYRRTRPLGHWPRARAQCSEAFVADVRRENRRDMVSVLLALTFFFCLFLTPMYWLLQDWYALNLSAGIVGASGLALYFTWYRHLGESL